jgi:tetratricopeptide (TPR) repeat protein
VVVSRENAGSDPVSPSSELDPGTLLTIYDLKGKYIAFRNDFGKRTFSSRAAKAIGEPIKHVVSNWGNIFIITSKNNIYRLTELDLASKLDIMFEKNEFYLAHSIILQPSTSTADIGKSRNLQNLIDAAVQDKGSFLWTTVANICKKHADYLYSKSDYDAAVKQYIKTIGNLEPSYVIRKFLDAQRVLNLTSYLQALHDNQLANGDHTTLLLNCYTKLNDLDHLNEFIDVSDAFDSETAIVVCRNSGYHQQALRIASKFEQHDWYIKLLVEDLNQLDSAISYLQDLDSALFIKVLGKYGNVLVSNSPKKMTALFVENISNLRVTELISFYISQPAWCVLFLECILFKLFGISFESHIQSSFIEGDSEQLKVICDTILDLELTLFEDGGVLPGSCENTMEEKIMKFLSSPLVKYDLENALFLCKQHKFKNGELYLCEKLSL